MRILFQIIFAALRLVVFVTGVILQQMLGFRIETLSFTPAGFKQVPTRYRFSMSAKKGRHRWKKRLR